MSKKRMIDTRFWHDSWVRKLNALDRYLFLYLLSNDKCSFCGIYELPISIMAFETGLDERDLEHTMLPRLEPKVFYHDGWVFLSNFKRHHVSEQSENSKKGYYSALSAVPSHIIDYFDKKTSPSKPLISPSGTSAFAFAFASAFNNKDKQSLSPKKSMKKNTIGKYNESESSDSFEESIDFETGELKTPPKKKTPRNKQALDIQDKFIQECEKQTGKKPIRDGKGYYVVVSALNHLKEDEIESFVSGWFSSGEPIENLVQITRCFSNNRINKWRATN